ncbi:MAG: CCDC90 family protein [Azoarcus sp.]|jgi:hypothetical protein|nr:CCDC90 family protein [Azoarcus sp.]
MNAITFDTLKYANRLKKAGFTPEQAEEQASALSEVLEVNLKELATKADIAMLRQEMVQLEQRMTIKLGTMLTIAVGAMVALTKLL